MDIENKYGCLEIQRDLLKIFKLFHQLCVENSINYSLIGGSLLGAVRDDGFIPWDDDGDVMILREDFPRLVKAIEQSKDLNISRKSWIWRVNCPYIKSRYGDYTPTLDLFLIDNMPDGALRRKLRRCTIVVCQSITDYKPSLKKIMAAKKLTNFFIQILGAIIHKPEYRLGLYDHFAQKSNDRDTEKKAIFYGQRPQIPFLYPKGMMNKLELHKFEDTEVFVTSDYDEVLTMTYGDYMTPPEESKRLYNHH